MVSIGSKRYCDILGEHLLPVYPNQRFKFIQDNATAHTARATISWLHEHGVVVVVFLSPIIHPTPLTVTPLTLIWNQMSHAVNSMSPTSSTTMTGQDAIERTCME